MATAADQSLPEHTWDTLRARFKQMQVKTNNVYQNWQIRVHRSLSWYKRALALPDDECPPVFRRESNSQLNMVAQFLASALTSVCRAREVAPSLVGTADTGRFKHAQCEPR